VERVASEFERNKPQQKKYYHSMLRREGSKVRERKRGREREILCNYTPTLTVET